MKRILIAGALALATAAPAFAADLPPAAMPPPRAPVAYVPAPVFSWTGFYIGANAGYAFGQSSWNSPIGTTGNFDVSGPMAGVTLGGNYQIGQFVVGAETDIDWQNVRGSQVGGNCNLALAHPPVAPAPATGSARSGAAPASPWTMCCSTQQAAPPTPTSRLHSTLSRGPAARNWAGPRAPASKYAMTDNWTAKVEYLFADFQHASCGAANCLAVPPASISFDESMVRVGINYKFGY